VPRPEHPRPDLYRQNWMSLNGQWQFEIDKAADGESRGLTYGQDLNAKIIVPSDSELVNVIGEMAGVVPVPKTPATPVNTTPVRK